MCGEREIGGEERRVTAPLTKTRERTFTRRPLRVAVTRSWIKTRAVEGVSSRARFDTGVSVATKGGVHRFAERERKKKNLSKKKANDTFFFSFLVRDDRK